MELPEPFIIGEMSANHNGSLARALKIIDAAAEAGTDAIKLQTYTPDTITIDHDGPDFQIREGPWAGRTLYELYTETHTPWEWHEKLFLHAEQCGLICFSSVFDKSSVDFLEDLGCPIYKISSFEITDIPLIEYVASKNKPIIISTGMANSQEIEAAWLASNEKAILLHCISEYPTLVTYINLQNIRHLQTAFGCKVGLSDHSLSTTLPAVAIGLGATVIEKHLTLRRSDGGSDSSFSLVPDEFKHMVQASREAWVALQSSPIPRPYQGLRRSVYAVKDIKAGEPFTEQNVRSIRPGKGLPPEYLPQLLGKKASRNFAFGEAITQER